jgi:hypothetical protein
MYAEPHSTQRNLQSSRSTHLQASSSKAQTSRFQKVVDHLAMTRKRKHQITYGKRQRGKPHHSPTLSSDGIEMFFPNRDQIDAEQKPPPQPPRPISQKAASMPAEPEEDKVQTFLAIAQGMSRGEAVRYLKVRFPHK